MSTPSGDLEAGAATGAGGVSLHTADVKGKGVQRRASFIKATTGHGIKNTKQMRLSFKNEHVDDQGNPVLSPTSLESLSPAEREFFLAEGHLYDMAFAVNVEDGPGNGEPNEYAVQLMKALSDAELFYGTEASKDGETFFIKVTADTLRFEKYASSAGVRMLADPAKLKEISEKGCEDSRLPKGPIAPFHLGHDPTVTPLEPYELIYMPYQLQEPKCDWFYVEEGTMTPFRSLHRFKMLEAIIKTELAIDAKTGALLSDEPDGLKTPPSEEHNPKKTLNLMATLAAGMKRKKKERSVQRGFNVRKAISKGKLRAHFPLHDKARRNGLLRDWLWDWRVMPWQLPFQKIRSYFGEKVALYYEFTSHLNTWLLLPALAGVVPYGFIAWDNYTPAGYTNPVVGIYGVMVSLWLIVMLQAWRRKEKVIASRAGMSGFEQKEETRPDFEGVSRPSLVSDEEVLDVKDKREKNLKASASASVISLFIGIVIAAVVAIFVLRFTLNRTKDWQRAGSSIASFLNAVQIQIMNTVYLRVAVALTKWENHRTDTQYSDALTVKLFAFQFVNSYASMIYIAFCMPYTGECDVHNPTNGCMYQLADSLFILMCTKIVTSIVVNIVVPRMIRRLAKYPPPAYSTWKQTLWPWFKVFFNVMLHEPEALAFTCEEQMALDHYDPVMDMIMDYAQVCLQLGFVTLFVVANPIIPLIGLVGTFVEARTDAYSMLVYRRRVMPMGAEDIGNWQKVFEIMAVLSVISNSALIAFSTTAFQHYAKALSPVWSFVILQYGCFFVQGMLAWLIPDVPERVTVQEERATFITKALIHQARTDTTHMSKGDERSLYTASVEAGLANTTAAGAWIGSGNTNNTDEDEHGDVSIAPEVVIQGADTHEAPTGEQQPQHPEQQQPQQEVLTPASVTIRTGDNEDEATDNSGMVDVDVNEPKEGGDL